MLFGKIEYLNLLPFHLFMKRYLRSSRDTMAFHYKRGVPSKINADFSMRRIDAAFISSVGAKRCSHLGLGIVARKEVLSVLVVPNSAHEPDTASATSNKLVEVLGLEGKVIIGDNALRHYLAGKPAIDLASMWHARYGLPFVFAVLCHHGHEKQMRRLAKQFKRAPKKIPQYLLHQASVRTGIAPQDILMYLQYISYEIDEKANRGLRKFWRLSDIRA